MKIEFTCNKKQQRLLALDQIIRQSKSKGITREEIIKRLARQGIIISLSTFNRDTEMLRGDLKAPLNNDYLQNANGEWGVRWFYTDPAWTLSDISLTEGTLFALLVSRQVMEQYAGLPVAKDLKSAFDQIADTFNKQVTIQHETMVPISFSSEKTSDVDPEVWNAVIQATMRHRRLQINYRKGWGNEDGKTEKRSIHPYHIVNLQGAWYLLGTASATDMALRQYAMSRIQEAKVLDHHFDIPETFDIKKIMDVTFGQFIGDPDRVETVHVRFSQRVAPLVQSRHFSGREERAVLPDGSIELKFPASSEGPWPYYHIKSWILSWGSDIEVLGPEQLKALVAEEIKKLAACASK
ncbi:MAG: WYL domain-containing protein [bacterium]